MNESWIQILIVFIANASLIAWFTSESRQNWRLMDSKMESFRAENGMLIRAIQEEMKEFHTKLAIQDQEFKTRICNIEERNKNK